MKYCIKPIYEEGVYKQKFTQQLGLQGSGSQECLYIPGSQLPANISFQRFHQSDPDIGKKFASTTTKTASIITDVLAPFAKKLRLLILGDSGGKPFSISVDASNYKLKLFLLVMRLGLRVRILDLRSMPYQISEQMRIICFTLDEKGLCFKNVTAFCANQTQQHAQPHFQGRKTAKANSYW